MDRNIYDNEFEEFLKQKSDQYKMYPSDRVWNNIYSSLHGRKKWWALGFTLFLLTGLLVGKQVLMSDYNRIATKLNKGTETISASKISTTTNSPLYNQQNRHVVSSVTAATDHIASGNTNNVALPQNNNRVQTTAVANTNSGNQPATVQPTGVEISPVIENDLLPSVPAEGNKVHASGNIIIPQHTFATNNIAASKQDNNNSDKATGTINQLEQSAARGAIKYSKWSLQFYASPTISYRRLTTLNTKGDSYIPVAANTSDNINNYVHHLPAPGFELGSNVQYKLSNSLTVFAGAQLNYSRYYIDAFKYHTEKASIALNNSQLHDTLSGYTNIRNFSGYAPEQLQNKYLQLSLPVGIEIKLLGDKKLQFSIAGGVQPTFLLTSNSYLISSDYKNYIQSPDLVRGFNVHTNFEAFISYKTGGLKWQVGPQFRSQLLSSYTNQYRVREYLTEYGIKFGVSRSF